MAALALAAGVARVFLGAKGPEYYAANSLFWLKMALFAARGRRFRCCRRCGTSSGGARRGSIRVSRPAAAGVAGVRRALWTEVALFAFIPLAAAGMARGYGI